MKSMYEQLRQAINASDKSRYRLAQVTGISESQLAQFMAGTKGLSVEAIENLTDALDLRVVIEPKTTKRKGT